MARRFGEELIRDLEKSIEISSRENSRRDAEILNGDMELSDCFLSIGAANWSIEQDRRKLNLLNANCEFWFNEFATLDGELCKSRYCHTKFGDTNRVEKPNGEVVWTNASTKNALAKKGLKRVLVKRIAWISKEGNYFPCDFNYATGETIDMNPLAIEDCE